MKWFGVGGLVGLLTVVTAFALCYWEQWRGEDSLGAAVRNVVLILGSIAALGLAV